MARTREMPKSIHGDISVGAVGEALLQHYNVGISNPWFELGLSQQETYNRRRLPWAGNNYEVSANGNVSGPNAESLPEGLLQNWRNLAEVSRSVLGGTEGQWDGLEDMYNEALLEIGDRLSS